MPKKDEGLYLKLKEDAELLIKETVKETVKAIEGRLAETLSAQIRTMIEPMKQSEVDHLSNEVGFLNAVLAQISKSTVGLLLVRRAVNNVRNSKGAYNGKGTFNHEQTDSNQYAGKGRK